MAKQITVATETEANILSQLPGAEETDITVAVENVEGQMDLITGDVVEVEETVEETELVLGDVVRQLTDGVFGNETTITAYKIHGIVNAVFQVYGVDKKVPPQMMYNYSRNGLIVKGVKGAKTFNKDEVVAFVERYTNKYI